MRLFDAMGEIESRAFALRANIASGMRDFISAIAHEEAVETLLDRLSSRPEMNMILGRVFEIAGELRDRRFEHPRDTAIATYLWLLGVKEPSAARLAASGIVGAEGLWWSREIARQIMEQTESRGTLARAGPLVSHQRLVEAGMVTRVDFHSGDDEASFVAVVQWTPSTVTFLPGDAIGEASELAINTRFTFDIRPTPVFFSVQTLVTDSASMETNDLVPETSQ